MKDLFYRLFALFFGISRFILPVRDNRVAFVSMHNESFNDSLGSVRRQLEERGGYELVNITKKDLSLDGGAFSGLGRAFSFFTVSSRQLATSRYVFLNDNFLPMSMLRFSPKTVVTQLWHAEGVFKKFGFAIEQPENVRIREQQANERLSYVVCTSRQVVPYYAEAFGVPEERVLPLGSPRTDMLFGREDGAAVRQRFNEKYPSAEGKKLVLYAPTFRDDPERDSHLLDSFPIQRFNSELGDEYALLIRLHPQLHAAQRDFDAIDLTDYENPAELVLICDVLITDYSSICMDFALLDKPTVFYAFDLDYYDSSRSFYFDYESYVPGSVVKTGDELIDVFKKPFNIGKAKKFREFNFDRFDGQAAKRVVDRIILQ